MAATVSLAPMCVVPYACYEACDGSMIQHSSGYYFRDHAENAPSYLGSECMRDERGRKWSRHFNAICDDHGNLVEVAS